MSRAMADTPSAGQAPEPPTTGSAVQGSCVLALQPPELF